MHAAVGSPQSIDGRRRARSLRDDTGLRAQQPHGGAGSAARSGERDHLFQRAQLGRPGLARDPNQQHRPRAGGQHHNASDVDRFPCVYFSRGLRRPLAIASQTLKAYRAAVSLGGLHNDTEFLSSVQPTVNQIESQVTSVTNSTLGPILDQVSAVQVTLTVYAAQYVYQYDQYRYDAAHRIAGLLCPAAPRRPGAGVTSKYFAANPWGRTTAANRCCVLTSALPSHTAKAHCNCGVFRTVVSAAAVSIAGAGFQEIRFPDVVTGSRALQSPSCVRTEP